MTAVKFHPLANAFPLFDMGEIAEAAE